MNDFIIIDEDKYMPIEDVRKIHTVTDQDREGLAQLGEHVNPDRFNTSITNAYGGRGYAPETIDELASQHGVKLVQVDDDTFVPRQNIRTVRNLRQADRDRFLESTGREMDARFQAQLETAAGTVLAANDAREIMGRMKRPYQPQTDIPNREMDELTRAERYENQAEQAEAMINDERWDHGDLPFDPDNSSTPSEEPHPNMQAEREAMMERAQNMSQSEQRSNETSQTRDYGPSR